MSLIFNFLAITASVYAYVCPEGFFENSKALNAHAFLSDLSFDSHTFKNNQCELEIILCDASSGVEGPSSHPIAELVLKDSIGRSNYMALNLTSNEINQHSKFLVNESTLYYEKKDTNYEVEFGRTEYERLEFRRGRYNELLLVEMGVYSTNNQLNHPNGNDSEWFVCK